MYVHTYRASIGDKRWVYTCAEKEHVGGVGIQRVFVHILSIHIVCAETRRTYINSMYVLYAFLLHVYMVYEYWYVWRQSVYVLGENIVCIFLYCEFIESVSAEYIIHSVYYIFTHMLYLCIFILCV